MDATTTSLADDLQELQLDSYNLITTQLKSSEELEKLEVDEQLTDIERAVYLLSSGQEVQRYSVITSLPDLLKDTESHDECMRRIVPKVREVLHVAQTEMQLAASSAFLQILQNNLVPVQNYSQTFLQTILNSVDSKDPEVATAWLDTLLDVIELLPKEIIKKEVLNVAIAKGQLSQAVQSRLACCKILGKIATKFEPFVLKKEILPVVQSLCQDVDYEVRGCMCRQLDCVSRGLGLEATKSAILPELVELTNDEESYVRIAGLETVVNVLTLLDTDTCNSTIIPLVCKYCQQAIQAEDITLPVVAKQLGKICHGLKDHMTDEIKQWFVDFYKKLCKVGLTQEKNRKNSDAKEESPTKVPDFTDILEEEDKLVECRKNCAFNFPAMVLFIGAKQFKSELYGTFSSLCKDPHNQVRKIMSGSYHEVSKLLGTHVHVIQPDLVVLLKDESIEVLKGVISNLPDILDTLTGMGSNHTLSEAKMNSLSEVIPAILNSEAVIFSSNNWRLQEDLMTNLSCLTFCCNNDTLYNKIIPILVQKILHGRALPVRHAASRSALTIIRQLKKLEQREEYLHMMVEELCHSRSCHNRSLFIDVCRCMIELYSKSFFKQHFFEYLLELHTDPVPNIRLRLCSILPALKKVIKLPTDRGLLQQLDLCVRKLLVSERDRDVQGSMKQAVEELDRIHVQMESLSKRVFFEQDLADQKKEDEEKRLIELEELEIKREEEIAAEKAKKGDKRNAVSAKKDNGSSKIPGPKKSSKGSTSSSSTSSPTSRDLQRDTSCKISNNIPNTKLVKSNSTNSLSQIPRRELLQSRIPLKPQNHQSSGDVKDKSDKTSDTPAITKKATKLPTAKSSTSGIKPPSAGKTIINMADRNIRASSPKLSKLPRYSSQPNIYIPSTTPTSKTTSKLKVPGSNKSTSGGATKTTTRASGIQAPGSAGRRGSLGNVASVQSSTSQARRGSLSIPSSGNETPPKSKGSNGNVHHPSTTTTSKSSSRKKSN